MRPFGKYERGVLDLPKKGVYNLDVHDTQDSLPKGARIRNKKHKRRLHKKAERASLKGGIIKEWMAWKD
jgi:hypothetical protein